MTLNIIKIRIVNLFTIVSSCQNYRLITNIYCEHPSLFIVFAYREGTINSFMIAALECQFVYLAKGKQIERHQTSSYFVDIFFLIMALFKKGKHCKALAL